MIIKSEIEQLYSDIVSKRWIDIETLYKHKEVIFGNDSTIKPQELLEIILTNYVDDEKNIKMRAELISLALDNGASANDLYFNIDNIYRHHELFLNHPINPLSLENFLQTALSTYSSQDENGQYQVNTKYTKKKAKILEIAYKMANNSLEIKQIHSIETIVVKELMDRGNIDNKTTLKLAFKASGLIYGENKNSYNLEDVALQQEILESLMAQDFQIDDFSFKELNIENQHISVLKLLLDKGLDPRALQLRNSDPEDYLDVLKLAFENNIKASSVCFIMHLFNKQSTEVFQAVLSSMELNIDDVLSPETVKNDFINQGPKFKEYFDDLTENVNFEDVIKPLFAEGGTILHIIVKADKQELVQYVLANYSYNINALNNLGQTPLFFAKSPEVAKALIEYQADLNVKDYKGNTWISNPSLELIEYAVANNYLADDYAERVALSHFVKGNYEHAAKLYKIGFDLNVNPIEQMVESIINGLQNSIEINKYQAMLHLINKAGIAIPSEFTYLLNSVLDSHKPEEFDFIYGLMHKLSQHYINLSKASLAKVIGLSEELEDAFNSLDFSQLKLMYPDNLDLAKITDAFSAYYQVAGKALNMIDNDFALEALAINGLRPNSLDQDVIVYRGMKVNLAPDDIDSYFKFGHRGFSVGEYQKTLGFYVDQPWNEIGGRWEYGGTYSSLEAVLASHFADGITSAIEAESMLLEIKIPAGSAKICGSWKHEYELVPSIISGENILAIYILDIWAEKAEKKYQVNKVHQNPYINATAHFKAYDTIKSDPLAIKAYNDLGCKDLPTLKSINKSGLYKNYTDFIDRYTLEDFANDQEKLVEDYFAGRELYVEEFSYQLNGECDLKIECCL